MSYANIVHNNSPSGFGVVNVNGAGSRMMLYCIFKNNLNYLFCVLSGSLEVSHSFINHWNTGFFSRSSSVLTSANNSFSIPITYQLQFFNSLYCSTDFPDRTLNQTPTKSLEKTISRTNRDTHSMTFERTTRETPIETLKETPLNTQKESPMKTIVETPMNTYTESLMSTIKESPMYTQTESLLSTIKVTQMKTIVDTPMNTQMSVISKTPYRSYDDYACSRNIAIRIQISVIFSFLLLMLTPIFS